MHSKQTFFNFRKHVLFLKETIYQWTNHPSIMHTTTIWPWRMTVSDHITGWLFSETPFRSKNLNENAMEVENPVNFFAEIVTKRYLLKITNLYIESIEKTCILGLPLNLPPLTFELHMYNVCMGSSLYYVGVGWG